MLSSSSKHGGGNAMPAAWATSPEREVPVPQVPQLQLPPREHCEQCYAAEDQAEAESVFSTSSWSSSATLESASATLDTKKCRGRRTKKHEISEAPPRPLAFRPVARTSETAQAWASLPKSSLLKAQASGSLSSSCLGAGIPSATREDVAADARELLRVLRAEQQEANCRLELSGAKSFQQQRSLVKVPAVEAVELGDLKQRVASMEQVLGSGFAQGSRATTTTLGLPVLLSEAEEEARQLREQQALLPVSDPLAPATATGAAGGGTGGSWERSNDLALLRQELVSWQQRHAAAEAQLATQAAAHALEAKCWENQQAERQAERSNEVEEFARVCAEALLGAGAAEAQAACEAKEAIARCKKEDSDSELRAELDRRRCRLLQEQESQILALHEQNAAQAFNTARCEEEARRFKEWSAAYETTAKAEALTAHRFRSELATAVQELRRYHMLHQQQLNQQALVSQAQRSVTAVVPRLETIPESSRESSAGSISPGRDDVERGEQDCSDADQDSKIEAQIKCGSSDCSLDSTVELEHADRDDMERQASCDGQAEVQVQRLREELAVAEELRQTACQQRDEAEKALAELRQEHSAVLVALRRGARLPAQLSSDLPQTTTLTSTDIINGQPADLASGVTSKAPGIAAESEGAPDDHLEGRLAEANLQLSGAMAEVKRMHQASCKVLPESFGQVGKKLHCSRDDGLPQPSRSSSPPLHWSAPGRIVSNASPPSNNQAVPSVLKRQDGSAFWAPAAVAQRRASAPSLRS
eukprot:TRINITY_DN7563_c0_g2_i1.p1 TRINITY_DN7563_c0_g2~~TRINITY_DN7563_c0_g2_i1.p1  ORF type:complete len:761 (+),score=185.51 TRINITY_DN7563_c0_g2_i1:153-2435(+)